MQIAGFQKNSFIDYPGKVALVVFLGGCNMRCHYCHNFDILKMESNKVEFEEILTQIKEQIGFIDGVVITGGEPTLHPHLIDIIKTIRELDKNLLIKLDTNGTNPRLLKELVDDGLIDYVAMDIKASITKYAEVTGVQYTEKSLLYIEESVVYLKSQDKVDYMFRTTLSPMLDADDFRAIAKWLDGAKIYQLQQFVPNDFSNSHKVVGFPYREEHVKEFAEIIKPHVGEVLLRGF